MNHRTGRHNAARTAETPASATPVTSGTGRRRAAKPTHAARAKFFPKAPALLGTAVLVIAGAGAVSKGGPDVSTSTSTGVTGTSQIYPSALTGSSAVASSDTTTDRERAVSRDSQRSALEDAADEELQEAAEAQAKERNAALAQLAASAEQHAAKLTSNTWSLPLEAGQYDLSATFGQSSSLWSTTHTGLDFAAPSGTPIKAVANGVVTSTEYDGSYGNKTVITDQDGTETWYCHQSAFAVSPGDQVSSGQVIGSVGSTGNSTGAHLHLEVRPGAGDPVDPFNALRVHGLSP
ncbi:MAG TPA: M23 family metallopeptidase [Nocardioidaceae bacterium]|nr:M23 family metallopeptidase [Nocardioidaceae bacterium]